MKFSLEPVLFETFSVLFSLPTPSLTKNNSLIPLQSRKYYTDLSWYLLDHSPCMKSDLPLHPQCAENIADAQERFEWMWTHLFPCKYTS